MRSTGALANQKTDNDILKEQKIFLIDKKIIKQQKNFTKKFFSAKKIFKK